MAERRVGRRALFTRFFSLAGAEARAVRVDTARVDSARVDTAAADEPVAEEQASGGDTGAEAASAPQVVVLQAAACIAYRGTLCTVCVERCPEPGAIVTAYGRPSIISEACTGCGECVAHCPAPVNALLLRDR